MRDKIGSVTEVSLCVKARKKNIEQDFTRAEATGDVGSGFRAISLFNDQRCASIAVQAGNMSAHLVSGLMIRFMGRELSDSSPEREVENGCPARIPESRRVVVPLFFTCNVSEGAVSPCSPLPCTRIRFYVLILTLTFRKQSMVARQSAPLRKLWISVIPLARDENITLGGEKWICSGMETSPF